MNKKVIPLMIQLKQNNNHIVQGIAQNDAGVIFDITIMDGLEPFNFSGYTLCTLKIQKPDETFTYDSTTGSYLDIVDSKNGRLKINIPTSCTAQTGMHNCSVSFAQDETVVFATMSFNYFVGTDPNAEDEDVIGTNEFPILTNLIAQVSGAIAGEAMRATNEANREDAEEERQSIVSTLIALFVEAVGFLEDKITDLESMLTQLNQAIADGGSIDVSTINALATKSYVTSLLTNALNTIDCGNTTKEKTLQIFRADSEDLGTLAEGEIAFATDTGTLYVGGANNLMKAINESCFVVSTTAPTDTDKLWVDTSGTSPVLKYHNGTAWTSLNTAVYG